LKVSLTKSWLAFLVVTLIAGCATEQPISLSPEATKSLDTVQTLLYVPQNNIDIDVVRGNPGSTGLLGALVVAAIDETRRASAQKSQIGISDAVGDFGFDSRMAKQLSAELARVHRINFDLPVRLEKTDSASMRQIAYDRSRSSAILFVDVSYKFIDGKLTVTAHSLMYPKSSEQKGIRHVSNKNESLAPENAIFRKSFRYAKNAVNHDNVREGLLEGISSIAWQLAADLNHAGAAPNLDAALGAPLPIEEGPKEPVNMTLKASVSSLSPSSPPSGAKWQGFMACDAREDRGPNFAAYKAKFDIQINGEVVAVQRDSAGVVETLRGKIKDSTLELRGIGYRKNEPSKNWQLVITGSFPVDATFFTGDGSMIAYGKKIRLCQLKMEKGSNS
jgi:hypothetical protein